MTTLTIRISDEQKRIIKTRAAYEGKTVKQFFLDTMGLSEKKGTLHEAMEDIKEGRVTNYKDIDELMADMETW